MLSRFVLFLPSAFCSATVFVNGALSHDFDAFARREREGWQIWILHLTASVRVGGTSPTAQECERYTRKCFVHSVCRVGTKTKT